VKGSLVGVTDHAVERYRQRVSGGSGSLDVRPEIVGRVSRAVEAGRVSDTPPDGGEAPRGTVFVCDVDRPDLVFVCRHDVPRRELVVITLWERGEGAAVPRRFTDSLRDLERARRPRS
jgi:hypothetical protein